MSSNDNKANRSAQREAARAQARELREARAKADKRKRTIIQVSVVAGILALAGAITAVVVTGIQNNQTNNNGAVIQPANMDWDNGIRIGQGFKAISKDEANAETPNITVYIDYQCPICKQFEEIQKSQLDAWVQNGAATVEIHPVAFLDGYPEVFNTQFSRNSANAAACVADQAPDSFYAFNTILFANQKTEGTSGPTNEEFTEWARQAGVGSALTTIENCITSKKFVPWVLYSATKFDKKDATQPGKWIQSIPGFVETPGKDGTPLVLINGKQVPNDQRSLLFDQAGFASLLLKATSGN